MLLRPGFPFKTQSGCATCLLSADTALCLAPWEPSNNPGLFGGRNTTVKPLEIPRAPSTRSVCVTPCPKGPTGPGDVQRCHQPHGEAQVRGTLHQAGLLLLGRWLCAQGRPWPTAHQHSQANTACRATNRAIPQPQGEKTGEKSASPIAGSGRERERPTLSTPTHRVATAPGWLGTALSVW